MIKQWMYWLCLTLTTVGWLGASELLQSHDQSLAGDSRVAEASVVVLPDAFSADLLDDDIEPAILTLHCDGICRVTDPRTSVVLSAAYARASFNTIRGPPALS